MRKRVTAPIFVITGQVGAGKSTVATALLDRFEFGYHVDVDQIREQVTSGRAGPLRWTAETTRQFGLATDGAAALARIYQRAGFAVVIEGAVDPASVDQALREYGLLDHRIAVVLHPRLEIALQRNRERTTKAFDPSILEAAIRGIDADLRVDRPPGWNVIDNSDEPVEVTVRRLLGLADDDPTT